MMGRRRKQSEEAGVDISPLIDMVFILLIFFMVTASFSADEDELSAAIGAEGGKSKQTLQPQVVRVRTLDGVTVYELGSNRVRTARSLANILRALPSEQGVVFRVGDDVAGRPERLP